MSWPPVGEAVAANAASFRLVDEPANPALAAFVPAHDAAAPGGGRTGRSCGVIGVATSGLTQRWVPCCSPQGHELTPRLAKPPSAAPLVRKAPHLRGLPNMRRRGLEPPPGYPGPCPQPGPPPAHSFHSAPDRDKPSSGLDSLDGSDDVDVLVPVLTNGPRDGSCRRADHGDGRPGFDSQGTTSCSAATEDGRRGSDMTVRSASRRASGLGAGRRRDGAPAHQLAQGADRARLADRAAGGTGPGAACGTRCCCTRRHQRLSQLRWRHPRARRRRAGVGQPRSLGQPARAVG
jgi:hypothetical protein